ncbi:hypothetical protein L9F63_013505, partial [Diploptera punctata]
NTIYFNVKKVLGVNFTVNRQSWQQLMMGMMIPIPWFFSFFYNNMVSLYECCFDYLKFQKVSLYIAKICML